MEFELEWWIHGVLNLFFVIDDSSFVPSANYASRQLSHEQAKDELRGKTWFWYIEDKDGETYRHLWDLTRRSQVTFDFGVAEFLKQCKVDPQRLRMGRGHTYLLLRADQNHELFTPATLNSECPYCDKPVSFKLPYGPEKFVCPHCGKESSIGYSPEGLSLIGLAPMAITPKPTTRKRPRRKARRNGKKRPSKKAKQTAKTRSSKSAKPTAKERPSKKDGRTLRRR